MKLEKFTKNKKQKRIVIGSIVGILLLIGGITLYRTFALYKVEQSFDVLKGTVPDFRKSDIELAIMLDDEKAEKIPEKGNYKVDISCNKEVDAEWDYYNWKLKVKDIINGTKCDLSFTSVDASGMPEVIVPNYKQLSKSISRGDLNFDFGDGSVKTREVTFDFSEVPNYQDLTTANFVSYITMGARTTSAGTAVWVNSHIKSYDAKTGIVTVSYTFQASSNNIGTDWYGCLYCTCIYAD